MIRTVHLVTAIVLVVASGVGHGMLTRRWADHEDLRTAARKLDRIPLTIGDWEGQSLSLEAREQEIGRIDGYIMRQYVNRATGATAQVLVVCGRPGPVAVHTPDVCYRGAGFAPTAAPAAHALDLGNSVSARLWTALFRRESATGTDRLRIFWSWTHTGAFVASDSPRVDFAGAPLLYKVYILQDVASDDASLDQKSLEQFMRDFLKEFRTSVFK